MPRQRDSLVLALACLLVLTLASAVTAAAADASLPHSREFAPGGEPLLHSSVADESDSSEWYSAVVDATTATTTTIVPTASLLPPGTDPRTSDVWGANEAARGQYNDTITKVGWSFLHIRTNPGASNMAQAKGAGHLEGVLTAERIYQYAMNSGANMSLPGSVQDFVDRSNSWLSAQIAANSADDYWQQVELWRAQVLSIQAGLFAGCKGEACTLVKDVVWNINIGATIGTLAAKFDVVAEDTDYHPSLLGGEQGRCSGFVRLTEGSGELFIGQDTWTSFNSMLRVYKLIDTAFRKSDGSIIPGRKQSFSSYPGSAFSGDDYYTMSSGLVACETTIGTYNRTSYDLITIDTVFESGRNTVANRLASSGEQWTSLFAKFNNGCYNNQFYVVDYNLFKPGTTPPANTLWVLEQQPGFTASHDVTDMLVKQGFFGSYNLPLFPETVAVSNISAIVKEYGPVSGLWFTYAHTARAKIMARDHGKVVDNKSMAAFMRYNDFKHDPLSRCRCDPPYTSENAIACRGDLNPANGTYSIPEFKQRNHAATDSKFTSSALMADAQSTWTISSPTYDQQPVFVWSESPYASVPHMGQPDRWDFPWMTVAFPQ